jgi:hypothetical protein
MHLNHFSIAGDAASASLPAKIEQFRPIIAMVADDSHL